MAAFFTNLMHSIFTPGPTSSLIVATNAAFAGLQVVLLLLLVATYSVHFVVLSFLSAGLWWGINWFVAELGEAQRAERERARVFGEGTTVGVTGDAADGGDSTDTETEAVVSGGGAEARKRRDVGGTSEGSGERPVSSGKSDITTEDEWEKVSENEKDK